MAGYWRQDVDGLPVTLHLIPGGPPQVPADGSPWWLRSQKLVEI